MKATRGQEGKSVHCSPNKDQRERRWLVACIFHRLDMAQTKHSDVGQENNFLQCIQT